MLYFSEERFMIKERKINMISIKGKKLSNASRAAAGFIMSMTAGAVLSGTGIAGVASFADISLSGALPMPYSMAVLVGEIMSCVFSGTVGKNIVKLSAMIIIMIAKLFLDKADEPRTCGIITAVGVIISGGAVSFLIGDIIYKIGFYVFYGGIAGYTAYSAASAAEAARRERTIDLTAHGGCTYAVLHTIFIAALCAVRLPALNAGIIVGAAVTLLAAYYYRSTGGVICGALAVCGAFLATEDAGMTAVMLPAAGFLTGYFSRRRPLIAAGVFVMASFLFTVLTGIKADSISAMADIIIGALIFLGAAPRYSDRRFNAGEASSADISSLIKVRMNFLADSLEVIRCETSKVSAILDKDEPDEEYSYEKQKSVCDSCYRRNDCWKNRIAETENAFRELSEASEVTRESFPYALADCLRKDELMTAFGTSAKERIAGMVMSLRHTDGRKLLAEQIMMTEGMLSLAGNTDGMRFSEPLSKQIAEKLMRHGLIADKVVAGYGSCGKIRAEIYFSAQNAPDSTIRVCDLISDELGIKLENAGQVSAVRQVRICLYEPFDNTLEVYAASTCADESSESGDTSAVFYDGSGKGYVILSDGMGSGKEAAVESRMAVRLFRRLICSGADIVPSVRLINSVILTKSRSEAFATLDAIRFDPENGRLALIKSGAAATLINSEGTLRKISAPTFPVGIYEQSEVYISEYTVSEGDMIIMFSDGVCENEYPFIRELLAGGSDLKKIVDEICSKAEVFNPSVRSDDVTVIGILVKRRR